MACRNLMSLLSSAMIEAKQYHIDAYAKPMRQEVMMLMVVKSGL